MLTLRTRPNWKEFGKTRAATGRGIQSNSTRQRCHDHDISNTPSDISGHTGLRKETGNTTTNPTPDLGTNATMTAHVCMLER